MRIEGQLVQLGDMFGIDEDVAVFAMLAELNNDISAAGEDAGLVAAAIQHGDRFGKTSRCDVVDVLHG